MQYDLIQLDTATPRQPDARILIIYTGGTFGMGHGTSGALRPFDFREIISEIPTLKAFDLFIQVLAFKKPIDSSNVNPTNWTEIADVIGKNYDDFDGFVVLHGTDTMAYTASAVGYMLEDLNKPVIFTGAQLPIAAPRTDARENLIASIEIASARREGTPRVPEVCIFFNNLLIRGNRAKKVESHHFDAFESENYPPLARAGVTIEYNQDYINRHENGRKLKFTGTWNTGVAFLKLFPGISRDIVSDILVNQKLKGVVMETFGSGNAPTESWFIDLVKESIARGLVIYNVSQCPGGKVIQGRYETSRSLEDVGVLSGSDITSEAAITKLMYLLGNEENLEKVKKLLTVPIRGEMSL